MYRNLRSFIKNWKHTIGFGSREAISDFDKRIFTDVMETKLIWREVKKSGKRRNKIMNINPMCVCVSANRSKEME